jgi:hypothetical protein
MYERTWEGLKCAVVNRARGCGSETWTDSIDVSKYDILVYVTYIEDKWMVSFYSVNTDIDVSQLAKKHDPSGGGHKGSAGCKFSKEDFPFY